MKKQLLKQFSIILLIAVTCVTTFASNCFISYAEDEIYYMNNDELEACYNAYLQSRGGNIIQRTGTRMAYNHLRLMNFICSPENDTGVKTIDAVRTTARFERFVLEGQPDNTGTLLLNIANTNFWDAYYDWLLQKTFLGKYSYNTEDGLLGSTNLNDENTVYDGKMIADDDGNSAIPWDLVQDGYSGSGWTTNQAFESSMVNFKGSSIKYGSYMLANNCDLEIQSSVLLNGTTYKIPCSKKGYGYVFSTGSDTNMSMTYGVLIDEVRTNTGGGYKNNLKVMGYPIVYTVNGGSTCYVGRYSNGHYTNDNGVDYYCSRVTKVGSGKNENNLDVTQVNLYLDIDNNYNANITHYPDVNVNGHLYLQPRVKVNGKYQPVTVDAEVSLETAFKSWNNISIEPDLTQVFPSPDLPTNVPDNPPTPLPDVGGGDTTDSGTVGGDGTDGTIDLPDFNFNLPEINWSIDGLSEKFPFSIPFDLMAMFSVLNAEPETPQIQGQLDLKIVTWNIDYDLHQFDGVASLLRNLEFIAFCIGLILITRSLIKG